jgi:uncharacterized surface protein with fasciclin (FAS1) repeats
MSPIRLLLSAVLIASMGATPLAAQDSSASATKTVVVQGDLVDTLKLSGQFTTLVAGIDATNLAGLLRTNKNLTVFAPTDAAFAAMPAGELARLQADKAAMQRFVLHHVINAPFESVRIKGAKGQVPSGAGDTILIDGSDEAGALRVDGAKIIQADVRTGSGLLHVVDKVLIHGEGAVDPPADPAPAPAPTTATP